MLVLTIPAGHKAGACADAKGNNRFGANAMVFKATDGLAYVAATDGHVISVLHLPDTVAPETPILVPAEALNANSKPRTVEVNGLAAAPGTGPFSSRPIKHVIPDIADCIAVPLCVGNLERLASAISPSGHIVLYVPKTAAVGVMAAVGHANGEQTGFGAIVADTMKDEQKSACRGYLRTHLDVMPASGHTFGEKPA